MRINKYQKIFLTYIKRLNDVRVAGQLLFLLIVLMISWSGVKTIQTNYSLQKQIAALKQQNDLQKLQNSNLKLQNQYYKTDQYLELSARQNFGLAKPGEKEVVVPQKVILAYTVDVPDPSKSTNSNLNQTFYERNFQSWINFFLHRQSATN
jgi:cell division protein FtsB